MKLNFTHTPDVVTAYTLSLLPFAVHLHMLMYPDVLLFLTVYQLNWIINIAFLSGHLAAIPSKTSRAAPHTSVTQTSTLTGKHSKHREK